MGGSVVPRIPLASLSGLLALGALWAATGPNPGARPSGIAPPPSSTSATEASTTLPRAATSILTVSRGDTLARLLDLAGVRADEIHAIAEALRSVHDPRALAPGTRLEVGFASPRGRRVSWLELRTGPRRTVRVEAAGAGFVAEARELPTVVQAISRFGQIETSLFAAAGEASVPLAVTTALIRALSFSVDFQRDIRRGDSFEVLYESLSLEDGTSAGTGALLYGAIQLSGRRIEFWRHESADGRRDYYDAQGASVRKTLMRTPLDGARISSGFGRRRHPVLGYTRAHRGVDFAASVGTPIYAAGDGRIERIGWNGGYGNYIRIRHNSEYATAYAHLRGFVRGLGRGDRVRQGQVIGYLGGTGRVSGPHLHYEVLVSGLQVNPRTVDLPSGETLSGDELLRFERARRRIDFRRGLAFVRRLIEPDPTPENRTVGPPSRAAAGP